MATRKTPAPVRAPPTPPLPQHSPDAREDSLRAHSPGHAPPRLQEVRGQADTRCLRLNRTRMGRFNATTTKKKQTRTTYFQSCVIIYLQITTHFKTCPPTHSLLRSVPKKFLFSKSYLHCRLLLFITNEAPHPASHCPHVNTPVTIRCLHLAASCNGKNR